MKGHIKSFRGLNEVDAGMYCRSVAEFTVSSFGKAIHWDQNSTEHRKIGEAFRPFLSTMFHRFGELFIDTLQAEIDQSGREAQNSIEAVFHLLPSFSDSAVKPFRNGSKRVSKHERRREHKKIEEQRKDEELPIAQGRLGKASDPAKESKLAIQARKAQS